MEAFNKAGIEIPFAQRDINIKNLDVLKNSLVERFEKNTQEVEK
jgi:small-conductance mechanosensitive channel